LLSEAEPVDDTDRVLRAADAEEKTLSWLEVLAMDDDTDFLY